MNFKRISLLAGTLLMGFSAFAQSAMTDQQVLDYIQQGLSAGRSTNTIATELAAKGVSQDQARRVYALYKSQNAGTENTGSLIEETRSHSTIDLGEAQAAIQEIRHDNQSESNVYGYSIFRNSSLNFSPSENMATPRNYKLGPGDEVIIDIFGVNQTTLRQVISPEGSINVDVLGPLYINGMTIDEANTYLKKRLSKIYSGLNRSNGTDLRLSLGQIRSIQVNVLGDVAQPGTYRVSSFSTVMHILYRAGGVKNPGTLRNVKINRNGQTVNTVDIYDLLIDGNTADDVRIEEGDVILVQPYSKRVEVKGQVKRPMAFELKDGETLADVLGFAGGFSTAAYKDNVTVTRQDGNSFHVYSVGSDAFRSFVMDDGDQIEVGSLTSIVKNRLEINGAVYLPGVYELSSDVHTVAQLVGKAGGLLPEAFTNRAVIQREHDDKTVEVLSVNLGRVLDGTESDVELRNKDIVTISSQYDLSDTGTMTIRGEVNNPGTFTFAKNTSIEDFIILAGGLRNGASTARVDISRRILNPDGTQVQKNVAELISVSINPDFTGNRKDSFILEPYDEVTIHRSPEYNIQRHFTVNGEVNFEGTYAMTSRDERLSDLVAKAGGPTQFAYVKGARLIRRMNEYEVRQRGSAISSLLHNRDTSAANDLKGSTYSVAIHLDKALQNPGSEYDVILREDDFLEIPVLSNTVNVSGSVMYPNAITYKSGRLAGDYIRLCGGYAHRAFRRHAYVVYMNGEAHKLRATTHIEPGSEIIVPNKGPREPGAFRDGVSTFRDMGYASAMIASVLLNLLK